MADTDEHKPEAAAVKGGGQEQHEAGLPRGRQGSFERRNSADIC